MIALYGGLARKFQKHYPGIDPKKIPCKVKSVSEAMRAMESQFKGFNSFIRRKGHYKIVRGDNVMDDNKTINNKELELPFEDTIWHFMPIAAGAAGKAVQHLIGFTLVTLSVVGMYLAPWAAPVWIMMTQKGFQMQCDSIGMSELGVIGNPMSLLEPDKPKPVSQDREETASYLFDGAVNISDPGAVVPVAYGETFVGSIVASFGIKTEAYA